MKMRVALAQQEKNDMTEILDFVKKLELNSPTLKMSMFGKTKLMF